MKRYIATFLLLGYVMLVPFCFFGGAMMADMGTMDMGGSPTQSMNDCGMLAVGCAGSTETNALGMIAHHVSMYLSIAQTPVSVFSFIMAICVFSLLAILVFANGWFHGFSLQTSSRLHLRRIDEPQSKTKQSILTWLSLFEISPNFA